MNSKIFASRRPPLLASLLIGLLLATSAFALNGRLVSETFHSKALEGNLLKENVNREVLVYLPPSYDSSPDRRYPLVYLLHGVYMTPADWTSSIFDIRAVINRFMTEHPDREMILVMPDGYNKNRGSWYANSPVTGNVEDFLTQELVQHIDSTYRTLPQAAHRGLAGYSMGGVGAWRLAMRYPEIYGAMYALSGGGPLATWIANEGAWRSALALEDRIQFSKANMSVQAIIAAAAAYSPNPDNPPFFVDLPYELVGEELSQVDAVWEKWLANFDVVAMAHTYREHLMQLRGIRFGFGTGESYDYLQAGWPVSQALTELGIPHVYEQYKGGHIEAIPYKIETFVLPFFAQALYGYLPAVRQATTYLGTALAGQSHTLDLQIEFAGPLEATGSFPQISLDLSPLGLEEVPLRHDGQGRYIFDGTLTPPHSGRFRLPVRLHPEGQEPYLFYNVVLEVWPTKEIPLFTDGLAPEWQTLTSGSLTLDPQAIAQVFQGSYSLGVKGNGFTLRFLPPEPFDGLGYTLHFAFHPGDAKGGSSPTFNVVLTGSEPSINLVTELIGGDLEGAGVDLAKQEWQVVEVPLSKMNLGEPAQAIKLMGTLNGTFYLEDIRLVPQVPPPQPTAVLEERVAAVPQAFALSQNFPNPFNSSTVIRFALPSLGEVELAVFNLAGQQVATLAEGRREAGAYAVNWDGRDERGKELASGLYLYRLQAGGWGETRKLLLLR